MATAKIFENGRSQAVRLPKEYRFSSDEVCISKIGKIVFLYPKEEQWKLFEESLGAWGDDVFPDGRPIGEQVRDSL